MRILHIGYRLHNRPFPNKRCSSDKDHILSKMKTSEFQYHLPEELIAQQPVEPRDDSRLMVLRRSDSSLEHRTFREIDEFLSDGDVLVFNNSRVIPARITGSKLTTGGRAEILLLRMLDTNVWEALVKPAKRIKKGCRLLLESSNVDGKECGAVITEVSEEKEGGIRVIHFPKDGFYGTASSVALPPYIKTPLKDEERYQTVYADASGSVAAPTAGLHFTTALIERIKQKGVKCLFITLHIGLDTFLPVRESDPRGHRIHREYGLMDSEVASHLSRARNNGKRIVCVGTTTARLLEAVAQKCGVDSLKAFQGWVDLFILPGYQFQMVDALVTNFHLPCSTLLMMVAAFAGKENIFSAYRKAVEEGYRFYSFGDAMLIL